MAVPFIEKFQVSQRSQIGPLIGLVLARDVIHMTPMCLSNIMNEISNRRTNQFAVHSTPSTVFTVTTWCLLPIFKLALNIGCKYIQLFYFLK